MLACQKASQESRSTSSKRRGLLDDDDDEVGHLIKLPYFTI